MNGKNLRILAFLNLGLGIAFEALSILIYHLGLFSSFWSFCSSPCTIWPGIPISRYCILVCVSRSHLYFPLFIIGTALLIIASVSFRLRHRM